MIHILHYCFAHGGHIFALWSLSRIAYWYYEINLVLKILSVLVEKLVLRTFSTRAFSYWTDKKWVKSAGEWVGLRCIFTILCRIEKSNAMYNWSWINTAFNTSVFFAVLTFTTGVRWGATCSKEKYYCGWISAIMWWYSQNIQRCIQPLIT